MHIAAALSSSSRPLDKCRTTAAGTDRVTSLSRIRLLSVTLRLPLSLLLHPKLATILLSGHTQSHTQLDLKIAFLTNSASILIIYLSTVENQGLFPTFLTYFNSFLLLLFTVYCGTFPCIYQLFVFLVLNDLFIFFNKWCLLRQATVLLLFHVL